MQLVEDFLVGGRTPARRRAGRAADVHARWPIHDLRGRDADERGSCAATDQTTGTTAALRRIPNFFVTYDPNAVALNVRQKFELSWKSRLDPAQFGVVAIVAGIQQARGDYSGFGDGAGGYAKRYAAAYATSLTRSAISQVALPSLFKQDPRYFYKGTGSTRSRIGYAISRTVVRKGDNGRWQPNYSGILGSLASGAISNLYYPSEDRRGVSLTLENTAIGLAGGAAGHLAQEFLFKKLTSHAAAAKASLSQ